MLKPLAKRTLNVNKKYLKEREHMKIQDREQTSIMSSLVAIETILAHESTPRPSLFKLLDEINFINTSQGMIGYGMIFITIAIIQRDRSITALIKKIPQNIKAN